jgi:putative DNA-invertase from lambdoid prophage Rac
MPRTFAYVRVSTIDQETQNQINEIHSAGFAVEPHRIISETISGSVAIALRPAFTRLLDKMEQGDVLIVTKLDRLGRNAIDVASTVARLEEAGIRVHCLALGGVDLTSSAGKLTMGVINGFCRKVWRRIKKLEFCSPPDTFRRQVSENFLLCGRNFG